VKKIKIITNIVTALIVVGFLTTAVLAATSDLSKLKGTGYSKIGKVYKLNYSSLTSNNSTYCIQHNKKLRKEEKSYTLKKYIEIDGKYATVYNDSNGSSYNVKSDLNAQVAFILNNQGGYGKAGENSDTQNALWHITNSWVTALSLGKSYSGNDKIGANTINKRAVEYADSIGDNKMSSSTGSTSLTVTGATNKNNLTVVDVGEYYRIGPFNWNFQGTVEEVTVTGDNGDVASSNVRFVKYSGNTANVIDKTKIATGESFYVDVNSKANMKEFKGIKIKTKSEADSTKVYGAKIWMLESSAYQNVIYVDVESKELPATGEGTEEYSVPLTINIGLNKVDDRDEKIPLDHVGFKLKASVYRDGNWVTRYIGNDLKWSVSNIEQAKIFYTDKDGKLNATISGETTAENSMKAVEATNDKYGYAQNIGKEFTLNKEHEVKITNHQYRVKLSGYVWLDTETGKTTLRDDQYKQEDDNDGEGFNGITVYLRDKNGNEIKRTTTSELGLYSEINGGEYQFVDVDLDAIQKGEYYVEFEYCGLRYQSVAAKLTQNNGSKAIDTATRNVLDSKFTSVDGNGTQSLNINGVTVNYNNTSNYSSSIRDCSGCNVYARTNEAGFNIYNSFTPGAEEIRYVNLGLFKKAQTDYSLMQDLYNVRVSVNGFSHIYRYGSVRYTNNGNDVNADSSWNVGVKFQKNNGTYKRAIYTADAEYEAPNHKDNELKVYVTYKIAVNNESTYLGRINSIVDYADKNFDMIAAGTAIDDKDNITGNLQYGNKQEYNDKYSKYVIDINTELTPGQAKFVYVQFQLNREAVLKIVNNQEVLNNVAEINSYTTFKDNNTQTPVAVVDKDSVPANITVGKIDTYEDDTDSATSLKLELKNARSIVGTVFVDNATVNKDNERLGNGVYDNGEATVAGVKVRLDEIGKDDSSYDGERISKEVTTDENGNFKIEGYIPGNYNLTYIWGNKTYKVQYYKGTIYDESRDQNDKEWYKKDVNTRKTDALDNIDTRKTIDAEMRKITRNNAEDEINKAYEGTSDVIKTTSMDSKTPAMSFSVEYETTITDGNDDKVEFIVKNVDFGIVERAKQLMDISKRVSAFKITLANGQVLMDAEVTEDGKLKGSHSNLSYMGPTNTNGINVNGILRAELDSELIEGATVEVTYAIKVTNVSEKDYDSPNYYLYGNKKGAQLIKNSVTGVIDYLDGKIVFVPDDTWEKKENTFIEEVNASEKGNTDYLNSIKAYYTSKLQKDLAPGESNEVTLKASKLLTSSEDNTFDNKTEIVDVTRKDGDITGTPVKVTWNNGKFFFDTDNAEKTVIIPSTGENRNYVLPTVIGIIAVAIVGVGVFFIKKYVVDRNK
jgi:hypothetical protein